jgi:hypothetical protein
VDERVKQLKTPESCERFIANVIKKYPNLAQEARRRKIELLSLAHGAENAAEREALQAIFAYEEVLTARNGRKTHASRTWQMVKRHGIIGAIERAVIGRKKRLALQRWSRWVCRTLRLRLSLFTTQIYLVKRPLYDLSSDLMRGRATKSNRESICCSSFAKEFYEQARDADDKGGRSRQTESLFFDGSLCFYGRGPGKSRICLIIMLEFRKGIEVYGHRAK